MNRLDTIWMRRCTAIVCGYLAWQMAGGAAIAQSSRATQRLNLDAWVVLAGSEFSQRLAALTGTEFTGAAVITQAGSDGAIVAALRDSEKSGELEIINQAKLSTVDQTPAEMQIQSSAAAGPDPDAPQSTVARSFKLVVTPELKAGNEVTLTMELTLAATSNVMPASAAAAAVRDVRTLSSKASMRIGDTFILRGPLQEGRYPINTANTTQQRDLLLVIRPRLEGAARR
jgi:hypothetical protein